MNFWHFPFCYRELHSWLEEFRSWSINRLEVLKGLVNCQWEWSSFVVLYYQRRTSQCDEGRSRSASSIKWRFIWRISFAVRYTEARYVNPSKMRCEMSSVGKRCAKSNSRWSSRDDYLQEYFQMESRKTWRIPRAQ